MGRIKSSEGRQKNALQLACILPMAGVEMGSNRSHPARLPGLDVEIDMHESQLHAAAGKEEDEPTQQAWGGGATMGDGAPIEELLKEEDDVASLEQAVLDDERDDAAQLRKELESAKEILSKLEEKLGPDPEEAELPCIARISVFGDTIWGGILTILLPLAGGLYLYYLISGLLDVKDYISFVEVGVVSDLPDLKSTFTCLAAPGCRMCPLPCTGGTGMVDLAAGASAVVKMPFMVIQNTWFIGTAEPLGYALGLAGQSEYDAGVPLGNLTGPTGGGQPMAVVLSAKPVTTPSSTSTKTIVTSKTLLDGTDEIALAPDGSDCTGDQLAACQNLKGGTLAAQLLLPPITFSPTAQPTPTPTPSMGGGTGGTGQMVQVNAYCTTVCSASFYIKTEVVTQDLGYMVLITLAATAGAMVYDFIGQFAGGLDLASGLEMFQ